MTSSTLGRGLLVLAIGSLVALPALGAGVCENYTGKQKIGSLGGAQAISPDPVTDQDILRSLFVGEREIVDDLFAANGIGELADDFFLAFEGDLETRMFEPGDAVKWMAYRKDGELTSAGPLCLATKKGYVSFYVPVDEIVETEGADPSCELSVPAKACHDEEIMLDASGSSDDVRLLSGDQNLLSGGSTSWSGMLEAGTYELAVEASATKRQKVVTHEFLIPQACGNLAYLGASAPRWVGGDEAESCRETKTLVVDDCTPNCSFTVFPQEIAKGEAVTVDAEGMGDIVVNVERRGDVVTTLDSFPATVTLDKSGTYTFSGTATRKGNSVACTTTEEVAVKGGDWIARFFGGPLSTEEERVMSAGHLGDGREYQTSFATEDGSIFGASIERLFTDKVGLEAALMIGSMDGVQKLDINGDWEMKDENLDFQAITLGVNFHLSPDAPVDVYLGPFIGYADLDDASYSLLGQSVRRELDSDFMYGAQLGLDIPFGDSAWGANLAARYMVLDADLDGNLLGSGANIDIDPLALTAGISVRF